MLPDLKKGSFLDPKTAGGSLGTSHLAFREKGVFFLSQKNAGGRAPHTRHLEKKGVFFGPQKPPEAAWAPHTWLLKMIQESMLVMGKESMLVMRERACW